MHIPQWHEYMDEEKVAWLLTHVIKDLTPSAQPTRYDMNLVARCEQLLTPPQKKLYIQYMSSEIAKITYAGMTDEECQLPATADQFYWNFITAPVDLRGRCIWHVVADFAP
jgi:hypothetical protein